MAFKTILMLMIYTIPFIFLCSGIVSEPGVIVLLYILAGMGMAGIGMGVMHDANHGSYSRNRKVNRLLELTLDMVGCSSRVWKIQHNILHHTYTNIEGHDDDIAPPFILRFSPHGKQNKLHKFQAFYFWIFYGLSTLTWVTFKDFILYKKFNKKGLIKTKKEFVLGMLRILFSKLLYFTYALIIPLFIASSPYMIIGSFLLMHFITGILISTVFQIAHVLPDTNFPLPEDNNEIQTNWYTHQMQTTANFSPKGKLFSWLIGGLNYQVEHHLFPNICHVHYRKISIIVSRTAKEYNIPYIVNKSVFTAMVKHIKMLNQLGKTS